MNKELQARTEVDSSTTDELLPSASIAQNPMLPTVLRLILKKKNTKKLKDTGYKGYAMKLNMKWVVLGKAYLKSLIK